MDVLQQVSYCFCISIWLVCWQSGVAQNIAFNCVYKQWIQISDNWKQKKRLMVNNNNKEIIIFFFVKRVTWNMFSKCFHLFFLYYFHSIFLFSLCKWHVLQYIPIECVTEFFLVTNNNNYSTRNNEKIKL